MENIPLFGVGRWVGVLSTILLIISVYFVLTFFQHLKNNDERLIKQSKLIAVFCLGLALLIPGIYTFYIQSMMMR